MTKNAKEKESNSRVAMTQMRFLAWTSFVFSSFTERQKIFVGNETWLIRQKNNIYCAENKQNTIRTKFRISTFQQLESQAQPCMYTPP